jgi:hypothetical protein
VPSELVDRDSEHLWLLSILHYAAAGVTALVGSFPLIHVAIGTFLTFMPDSMRGTGKDAFPREIGVLFMGLGLVFVAAGWSLAAAHFMTARFLKQKRHYVFCVAVSVVSCFACMFSSGIISIATLVVLFRPGVHELFDRTAVAQPNAVP